MNKSGKPEERKQKINTLLRECQKSGIKFLKLDINKSKYKFTVEDNGIRLGFCALASFSANAYEEIKKCMPFEEDKSIMEQIYEKTNKRACSSKAINPLILSEAFGDNVVELYEEYYYLNAKKKNPDPPTYKVFIHKTLSIEVLASEEEIEESLFNANFIHNRVNNLKEINYNETRTYGNINGEAIVSKIVKRKYDNNNKRMAILTLETTDGMIEGLIFDNNYKENMRGLKKNNKINLSGKKSKNDNIIINKINII